MGAMVRSDPVLHIIQEMGAAVVFKATCEDVTSSLGHQECVLELG